MKRLYVCAAIVAVLLLLVLASDGVARAFTASLGESLDTAQYEAQAGDTAAAGVTIEGCSSCLRRYEPFLALFVRRESLTALEATFRAAASYAQFNDQSECCAELARAAGQLETLRRMFGRLL